MRLDGSVLRSHTEVKSQRHASTRLTLLDTFLQYRGVHYKDGAIIIFFYVFYRVTDLGDATGLPMLTVLFSAICWLTAPTIFSPYPTWFRGRGDDD